MKLILVHGRDQQNKNPVELKAEWLEALGRGLHKGGLTLPTDVEVLFPFYGDKLAELVEELNAPLVADVSSKGSSVNQDTKESAFRGAFLEELRVNAGITDEKIQSYSPEVTEKGVLNWEWVQAIIRALDETCVGEASIDKFTRDVYVYLTNSNVRRIIDAIVHSAIPNEPCVIVGHSLGSVVAYNVLKTLGNKANVKRYITVGSPLGVKTIQNYLLPPSPAVTMPSGVTDWYNAFDERDVVALRALDEKSFRVLPPITNKSDVDNRTDNHHGIVNYLDDSKVARWIYDALI